MRVFTNRKTMQVIVVVGNMAYAYHSYPSEDPFEQSRKYVELHAGLSDYENVCREIASSKMTDEEKNDFIKRNSKNVEIMKSVLQKEPEPCEHSQSKRNAGSSTDSIPATGSNSSEGNCPPNKPNPSENGKEPETQQ